MIVELILSTPENLIGEMSKICYATKQIEDGGKDITSTIVHDFKHLASLRFAYATFHIEGVSVACQNQVVRSKHLDFMVQSKRYVTPEKGGFKFIMPDGLTHQQSTIMKLHWEDSIESYNALLSIGVKKEDARAVLPANTSTNMNITGNLQAFHSFFVLRLNKHAQTEIRNLANIMYKKLSEVYPNVFTDKMLEQLQNAR